MSMWIIVRVFPTEHHILPLNPVERKGVHTFHTRYHSFCSGKKEIRINLAIHTEKSPEESY